jgi:hypothetical protein
VTVGFGQYRGDELRRIVVVSVTNTGPEPLVVDSVRLDAAGFEPGPAVEPGTRLAPGETTAFRVTYVRPLCDRSPADPAPGARITASAADGRPLGSQQVAFTQGRGQFDQVQASECAALALRESVELSWGPSWSPGGREGSLRGVLQVRRLVPGPAVSVDQFGSTTILTVWPVPDGARPAGTMPEGDDEASIPVEILPTRCDDHARIESKKTFIFPVWVALGEGSPVYTTVTPSPGGRERLQAMIDEVCGV